MGDRLNQMERALTGLQYERSQEQPSHVSPDTSTPDPATTDSSGSWRAPDFRTRQSVDNTIPVDKSSDVLSDLQSHRYGPATRTGHFICPPISSEMQTYLNQNQPTGQGLVSNWPNDREEEDAAEAPDVQLPHQHCWEYHGELAFYANYQSSKMPY